MQQICRWHVYQQLDDLRTRVAHAIARNAQQAIAGHGAFWLVLTGGSTPLPIYETLREINAKWSSWHIFFGDERCLPAGDPGRNDTAARAAWLDHVTIPEEQIHSIPAELGAEAGAKAYEDVVAKVEQFDLVLLGLGKDGHTASLFSGHDPGAGDGAPQVLAVHDAPKPPADRISLSARRLSEARRVSFLISGESKRQAVWDLYSGKDTPAAKIAPTTGIDLLMDFEAMPKWADPGED